MMKKQGNACRFCVIHALAKNIFQAQVSTQTQDYTLIYNFLKI